MRATFTALGFVLTLLAACGSRTGFETDVEPAADASAPDGAAPAKRSCAVTLCTIGHECCVGGCAGPAAVMPSDCCPCLPGEVSSQTCPRGRCAR
jgi:hypothetical protein